MAHSAFSTALNRLRKLLGNKQVIQLVNGKISLDSRYCWVDALAFQDLIEDGNAAWDHRQRKEAVHLYETAVSWYKGPFLSGEAAVSWIISARERCKNWFLTAIMRLGRFQEQEKRFEKARILYEKALSIDDLEEPLYQRLITCQLRLGRRAEASRTYQRCRERLSAVLDVEPSPQTETLRRQINRQTSVDGMS
jgi:DNA-binding SARP family transcriptional activator